MCRDKNIFQFYMENMYKFMTYTYLILHELFFHIKKINLLSWTDKKNEMINYFINMKHAICLDFFKIIIIT